MSLRAFATLLDRLSLTASRNAKLVLVRDHLASEPDPERGWALAALCGELSFKAAKPAMIRRVVETRVDPVLFAWSYDFVGDLAETAALVWPQEPSSVTGHALELDEVVDALARAGREATPDLLAAWMDRLDAVGRWALLKLLTGALRVGVSARLAKTAALELRSAARPASPRPSGAPAQEHLLAPVTLAEVEEVWACAKPPYGDLFAWLEGRSERPSLAGQARFRPVMLAQALDPVDDFARLSATDYAAEWKWDGIRVQVAGEAGERRLWSRTGDDISSAFPDVAAAIGFEGVLDGELLVMRAGEPAPFADLQQRLNRKTPDARLINKHPAGVRLYDLLQEGDVDLRGRPFAERRARLEALCEKLPPRVFDLSPLIAFSSWEALAALRSDPPVGGAAEGVMLKRWDSAYEAGRPRGPWFKWKRDPFRIDAVLMYAQRGHGKRSSFYSDYTFGVWTAEGALAPVGKAYFGFTDVELAEIDRFVRNNTVDHFGPVRAVRAEKTFGLVFEVAFEGLQRSPRHRSGLAMRFPRIARIRWDKPAAEAATLDELLALLVRLESGGGREAKPPD